MLKDAVDRWTTRDSEELYEVAGWGHGYFSINDQGHVQVHPDRQANRAIDLKELVDRLQLRGVQLPILVRFNGILRDRLHELQGVFATAIEAHEYEGKYCCVYPIKVNQQRQIVEQVVECGRELGFGLEAGSKPELLAVVAMADGDIPIICNGFKDAEFIEMALLAQKIGRTVIPVVEKYTELDLILRYAERVGVRPTIGVRAKLAARGSGRWQSSGGYRSKFGLTTTEILRLLDDLDRRGMADCLQLLHYHLGSQITNIRFIQNALVEATRIYCELHKRGAGMKYLDVGGGLGVDYDGSQTNFESSVNYTLQEYANDVVSNIQAVCDETEVPHPIIISESGRAIAAYHSVLVYSVLGVSNPAPNDLPPLQESEDEDLPHPLQSLRDTYESVTSRTVLEAYHIAQQAIDMSVTLFNLGHMSLDQRAAAESYFWALCVKIRKLTDSLEYVPEELQNLDEALADTVFCNFSLFQSMPDSWAIKQLFPVMPIHRLEVEPTRHAVLGDITCDSDGKLNQFIDRRDVRRTLLLHEFDGSPYYLGAFLLGAYQEILGDLHNLFGDTNAVHVSLNGNGEVQLDLLVKGETVAEVLNYVQFTQDDLLTRLQSAVELAVRSDKLTHSEAGRFLRFYEDGLNGYTYLEDPGDD